ncbi:MAG: PEP-CTERM sorting domain-containing protein [Verrucomicrobiota bacterium JB022]|nr:PEP-CTERM sorting domain-containing protein [Verrucomicrobiota bacterium JB022]
MKSLIAKGSALLVLASQCSAFVSIEGLTFTVADATTFHSSSSTALPNLAEVGELYFDGDESQARGLSEFNLSGLTTDAASVMVQFEVINDGGIFFANDFPFDGGIAVEMYLANNTEDLTDFWIPSFVQIADFATSTLAVGQILMFDATEALNYALSKGATSLGIRLQADPLYYVNGGAWTFGNFELTYVAVPEPSSTATALGVLALGAAVFAARRRRA